MCQIIELFDVTLIFDINKTSLPSLDLYRTLLLKFLFDVIHAVLSSSPFKLLPQVVEVCLFTFDVHVMGFFIAIFPSAVHCF